MIPKLTTREKVLLAMIGQGGGDDHSHSLLTETTSVVNSLRDKKLITLKDDHKTADLTFLGYAVYACMDWSEVR
ncbi:hypothetical protein ACFL3R_00750 [Thermodesulfobacteriota bacterium]